MIEKVPLDFAVRLLPVFKPAGKMMPCKGWLLSVGTEEARLYVDCYQDH